jgi:cytochrome P450 family 142 subfamily A polypeptide 1
MPETSGSSCSSVSKVPASTVWLRTQSTRAASSRWVTPVLNMCRVANRDYDIGGQTIREGQQVVLMYPSANRDPKHFEDPERYDVTRTPNHHIAFGFGTHFCLGAALARLEIKMFFDEFVRRVSAINVVPGSVDFLPNAFVNGVNRAEVELVLG